MDGFCHVEFSTHDGGGCKMKVSCDGLVREYNDFQVCEVGKQQYWTDSALGDFSIEYSEAGGINAQTDGLHGPYLRFRNIGDWEPLKVEDYARNEYAPGDHDDEKLCWYKKAPATGSKTWQWGCGIPKKGESGGPEGGDVELSNESNTKKDYEPGNCQIHLIQHQKPKPKTDPYRIEAWIKDAVDHDIGEIYPKQDATPDKAVEVNSKLGAPVKVTVGGVDADPVAFEFLDAKWDSNDSAKCHVDGYNDKRHYRKIKCSFDCK